MGFGLPEWGGGANCVAAGGGHKVDILDENMFFLTLRGQKRENFPPAAGRSTSGSSAYTHAEKFAQ